MPGLSPFAQSVLYGVITKSIGSIFRVTDDLQAPPKVLRTTAIREGILLGLTTLYTTFTQMVFSGVLGKVIHRNPGLKNYELVLRAGFTAIGIMMAEVTSRAMAPKVKWSEILAGGQSMAAPDGDRFRRHDDDDDDRGGFPDETGHRRMAVLPAAPLGPRVPAKPLKLPLTFSNTFTNPMTRLRFPL